MGVVFGLADRIAVVVYGEVIAFDTPQVLSGRERQMLTLYCSLMGDPDLIIIDEPMEG